MANGKSARNTHSWMLYLAVIFAVIANLFLSVNAIRCHQCNSHVEEDCNELRLNIPRTPIDTQYLKECEGESPEMAFCRKTTFLIEHTKEHRIIRSCGFLNDHVERNNSCFEADNEGYKQTICACFEDGCNSAPVTKRMNSYLGMGLASCSVLIGSLLLRRFA